MNTYTHIYYTGFLGCYHQSGNGHHDWSIVIWKWSITNQYHVVNDNMANKEGPACKVASDTAAWLASKPDKSGITMRGGPGKQECATHHTIPKSSWLQFYRSWASPLNVQVHPKCRGLLDMHGHWAADAVSWGLSKLHYTGTAKLFSAASSVATLHSSMFYKNMPLGLKLLEIILWPT